MGCAAAAAGTDPLKRSRISLARTAWSSTVSWSSCAQQTRSGAQARQILVGLILSPYLTDITQELTGLLPINSEHGANQLYGCSILTIGMLAIAIKWPMPGHP